jgi:hypothetical protein
MEEILLRSFEGELPGGADIDRASLLREARTGADRHFWARRASFFADRSPPEFF